MQLFRGMRLRVVVAVILVLGGLALVPVVGAPAVEAAATTSSISPNAPARTLTLAAGDSAVLQFQGLIGQTVTISAADGTFGADCDLQLRLRNPSGSVIGTVPCAGRTATIGPRRLGVNGNFRVELEASRGGGSITVAITATADKRSVTPNAPALAVRVGPGGTVNLGFRAIAGQQVGAATDLADDCRTTLTLFGPDGTAVAPDACAGTIAGPIVVPTTGVYRTRLRNTGAQPITLRLEVFAADPVPDTVAVPGNVVHSIAPGGSFEIGVPVQSGHFLAVTSSIQLSGDGVVTFLQPDGGVLPATDVFVRAVSAVATTTGVHRVRITNTSTLPVTAVRFDVVTGVHGERTGTIDGPVENFDLQPADRFTLHFAGVAGQSVDVRYPATSSRCVTLQRPDGSTVRRDCGASSFIQIVDTKLDVSGAWTVVIQSGSEFARSSSVQVVSVPDPTPISIDGAQGRLAFSGPGETSHLEFAAVKGQHLVIAVSAAGYVCFQFVVCACPGAAPETACPTVVELVDPEGRVAEGDSIITERSPEHDPLYLRTTVTSTGLWQVRAVGVMGGVIGITVIDAPDLTSAVALKTPFDATADKVGQRSVISFPVQAGRRYGLVDLRPVESFGNEPVVEFLQPDGTPSTSASLTNTVGFVGPFLATATGTAKVVLEQLDGLVLDERVELIEVGDLRPVVVPVTIGVTSKIVRTDPTQISRFTFTGAAGTRVALDVSSFSYPGAVTMRLRLGDRVLAEKSVTSSTAMIDPVRLDASGTWTVEIDAPRADVGGLAVRVRAVTDIVRAIAVDGASQSFTLTQPGQRALLTFSRTSGRRFRVRVTDPTLAALTLRVLGPDGSVVQTCALGTGTVPTRFCSEVFPSSSGNYTIVFDPPGQTLGSLTIAVISA